MAESVKEQELLKELRKVQGRGTFPDARSQVLEQPAGRDWRRFHQVTLRWIAAITILGMLAVLIVFYLIRGMVRIEAGRSGRTLVRFNAFERFVHWMTATCFIILALSGLNITFGKELLMPLIGQAAFASWSQWAKYAHNYLSFPFTLGVVLMFLMWIAWNFPSRVDARWIREGGGIVGGNHPPARRFNAGQKLIYWVVVLGGGAAGLFSAAVVLSSFGCLAATILYSSRIYLPMARDGLFFAAVGRVHSRHRTPHVALWAQSGWAAVLLLSGTYAELYTYVTFASVLFLGACGAAALVLRRTRPELPRPYRTWGWPVVPCVFLAGSALLTVSTLRDSPRESLAGLGIVALGLPAYAGWRSRARETAAGDR